MIRLLSVRSAERIGSSASIALLTWAGCKSRLAPVFVTVHLEQRGFARRADSATNSNGSSLCWLFLYPILRSTQKFARCEFRRVHNPVSDPSSSYPHAYITRIRVDGLDCAFFGYEGGPRRVRHGGSQFFSARADNGGVRDPRSADLLQRGLLLPWLSRAAQPRNPRVALFSAFRRRRPHACETAPRVFQLPRRERRLLDARGLPATAGVGASRAPTTAAYATLAAYRLPHVGELQTLETLKQSSTSDC
jgi:hypothetical protein